MFPELELIQESLLDSRDQIDQSDFNVDRAGGVLLVEVELGDGPRVL